MFRILLVFSVLLVGCSYDGDQTKVMVNDKYSITVPAYLKQTTELHNTLPVQLQSIDDDVYLVVISENKAALKQLNQPDSLPNYHSRVLEQSFLKKLKNVSIDTVSFIKGESKYNTIITNITGEKDEEGVFYKIGFIECADTIYQIVIWTRKSKKEFLEDDMLKIIESFKEEKTV
jgi:hypothetical protein